MSVRNNNMTGRIFVLRYILIVFGFMIVTSCEQMLSDEERLKVFVAKVNKKCPTLLDSETQFDGIDLKEGNIIRYKYTLVNVFSENVDKNQFYRDLWPGILSDIKISSEMKNLRDKRMTVEYYYQDKDQKPIYTFKITPEDYLSE